MSYKCCECGRIFEEADTWKESRGEFWGFPAEEKISGCPFCGGDFEELAKCEVCGKEHFYDDLKGNVCEKCIDKYRYDFKSCYDLLFGEKEEIKIHSLLAALFEPSDIEAILIEHIKTHCRDIDCSPIIDNDIHWFGEKIVKEIKKNERKKKQP